MRFIPALLIFAAGGAGYVYSQGGVPGSVNASSWFSELGDDAEAEFASDELAETPSEELVAVAGPSVSDFADIFRFDVTPEMIGERWSRVSTGLSQLDLQGYRVPLMTGTEDSDLAGSLTYYFDQRPRVRRITFIGTTGNPEKLVDMLTQEYGFHRLRSEHARETVYGCRYGHNGLLRITPADVLDRDHSFANYRVDLTIAK